MSFKRLNLHIDLYYLGGKCHRKSWVCTWKSCSGSVCLLETRKSSRDTDLGRAWSEKGDSDCKVSILCLWNGAHLLSFPHLPALCLPGTCRADAETELRRPKRLQFINTNPSHLISDLIPHLISFYHLQPSHISHSLPCNSPDPSCVSGGFLLPFSSFPLHCTQGVPAACPGLTLRLFCSWSGAVHTGTGHCCPGLAWGGFILLGKGLINWAYW